MKFVKSFGYNSNAYKKKKWICALGSCIEGNELLAQLLLVLLYQTTKCAELDLDNKWRQNSILVEKCHFLTWAWCIVAESLHHFWHSVQG